VREQALGLKRDAVVDEVFDGLAGSCHARPGEGFDRVAKTVRVVLARQYVPC
jgi:hypothetical protein